MMMRSRLVTRDRKYRHPSFRWKNAFFGDLIDGRDPLDVGQASDETLFNEKAMPDSVFEVSDRISDRIET
jgi:hypothetical protein